MPYRLFDPDQDRARRRIIYGDVPTGPLAASPAPGRLVTDEPEVVGPDVPPKFPSSDQEEMFGRLTEEVMHASKKGEKERELYRQVNYMQHLGHGMDPNAGFEYEGSTGPAAGARLQEFNATDPEAAFSQPDRTIADPNEDSFNPTNTIRNVTNFLFSDEMGMLGFKWDQDAFTWSRKNFVNQITEHPYSTAFTLASYLIPMGAAWMKAGRVASRGSRLAMEAEMGLAKVAAKKVEGEAGKALSFLGEETVEAIAPKAERAALDPAVAEEMGALAASGRRGLFNYQFDDRAKLVQLLANSPLNDQRKLFSDSVMERLRLAKNADEVNEIVPKDMLNKILISDWHQERYLELRNLAKQGKLETVAQKASWQMWNIFGNKYFQRLTESSKAQIDNLDQFFVKAQLGRYLAQAPTNLGVESEQAIYKYWLGHGGRDIEKLSKEVGDENALYADTMLKKWKDLFQEQGDEGFIDANTIDKFMNPDKVGSEFHLPAILKDTPGFEDLGGRATGAAAHRTVTPPARGRRASDKGLELPGSDALQYASSRLGEVVPTNRLDVARALSGPTMFERSRFNTQEAVLDSLDALETNPRSLVLGGFIKDNVLFQIHRNFRDIIVDAVENPIGKWAQATTSRAAYEAMPAYAKKEWMDFAELEKVVPGLAGRMERMVSARVKKDGLDPKKYGQLPMLDRSIVQQFFGPEGGAIEVGGVFGKFFELMTAVHKTSRTALNPASQSANIVGNMMMLAMRGMNPFSSQALNDAQTATSLFRKLNKQKDLEGATVESLMNPENLAKLLGDNRYITDKMGKQVDVADLLSSFAMRDIVEAQSFEELEGLRHVHKVLKQMEGLERKGWSHHALAGVARSIAGVGEVPYVKPTLEAASAAYLAGDMVPKMMYAFKLARDGFGHDAIVREIGRALPQYRTVGHLAQSTRRIVFPWITFPAEAARIMKNNMMDRPVQMMAWMQAPQIAQSVVSGLGMGPDFKEYEDTLKSAPPWAVRYQTVLADGEDASEMLGAVGAAGVGAIAGTAMGGARGAAIGAAAGAVGGALLGKFAGQDPKDELREFNRAWTLDWLPQSALFPQSMHPGEWEKLLPTGLGGAPTPGKEWFATAKEMTPVEPFAVFMPLLDLYSGRGQFGEEIQASSGIQFANKLALGLLGHLSPPIMQKYGMKLEGPGGAVIPMGDSFDANGGQMTLPKYVTSTFWGLSAAGLTAFGAGRLGAKGAALLGSAALSGVVGGMAGAEMNTRRLMTDLGISPDYRTEEYGDWTLDFFANSLFGLNKSWKASPQQSLYNESVRQKRFIELRKGPVKSFRDAIIAGRESDAKATIGDIYKTYVYEHGDTNFARREFLDWAVRTTKSIQGLPIYDGMSDEQLRVKYAAILESWKEASNVEKRIAAELRSTHQERAARRATDVKILEQK
jgi:hypothetical protein